MNSWVNLVLKFDYVLSVTGKASQYAVTVSYSLEKVTCKYSIISSSDMFFPDVLNTLTSLSDSATCLIASWFSSNLKFNSCTLICIWFLELSRQYIFFNSLTISLAVNIYSELNPRHHTSTMKLRTFEIFHLLFSILLGLVRQYNSVILVPPIRYGFGTTFI